MTFLKTQKISPLKTILVKNESSLGENGYFFRILHEILTDNMVSNNFFGPHFDL
jgi:hypothetical protein